MSELSASEVEAYLQMHPDFFNEHLPLLETLTIPHPSGAAVSLVSKQLELFRRRHNEMEGELKNLISIAQDNNESSSKMHELTLAILEADTLDTAVHNLEEVLKECFLTDFSSVKIITHTPCKTSISDLFVEPDAEVLVAFVKELTSNHARCGRPTVVQAEFLFGSDAFAVQSCAIIPMAFKEIEGLIAVGSRDAERFNQDMGHLFLTQISEIVGTRLIALLKAESE